MGVSVIIPALNRAGMISRALDSVSSQTRRPDEVIVVDDCSDDDTAERARDLGAVVLTMPARSGSGPARNAGIAHASGEWVAFLDSDDEWDPDHLEVLLASSRDQVLVSSPARTASGRLVGNPTGRTTTLRPLQLLIPGNLMLTSGTVVRRTVLDEVGGFRPLPRAQDLDLWLRVLEHGPGLALGRPTVTYHEHAGQASRDRHLTRAAYDLILEGCVGREWFTEGVRTRSYAWMRWDDLRSAQRDGEWRDAAEHAAWFVRHPSTVGTLVHVLQQRRLSRALQG